MVGSAVKSRQQYCQNFKKHKAKKMDIFEK